AVIGTVSHMAPEQIAGRPAGPAGDWYAVGVLLYQALTGRLPFTGTELEIVEQKQLWDPVPPGVLVAGIPADLDELCLRLLARETDVRIAEAEVLRRLAGCDAEAEIRPTRSGFVGRAEELEVLEQAFRDSWCGQPVVMVVRGDSGVGKTSLVTEFG